MFKQVQRSYNRYKGITTGTKDLQQVQRNYNRYIGITTGAKELQQVQRNYNRCKGVTPGTKVLQQVQRTYNRYKGITAGTKGLQQVQRNYNRYKGIGQVSGWTCAYNHGKAFSLFIIIHPYLHIQQTSTVSPPWHQVLKRYSIMCAVAKQDEVLALQRSGRWGKVGRVGGVLPHRSKGCKPSWMTVQRCCCTER